MKTVEHHLRHAKECEELAAKTASPEYRRTIIGMAETWRTLARQRKKKLEDHDPV